MTDPANERDPWGWTPRGRLLLCLLGLAAVALVASGSGPRGERGAAAVPVLAVDPGRVPAGVLGALPGLGAARVEALRQQWLTRPPGSLPELARAVPGVGPATAASIAPHLRMASEPGP
jgi:hypothetical protein